MTKTKSDCVDKHCPAHAGFPTRGNVIEGKVVSDKAKNTVIIERSYLRYIPKYERYERRTTRIAAHKPDCMKTAVGDKVKAAECRKISKTKAFVLVKSD